MMEKFRNIPYNGKRHRLKRETQKCISLSTTFARDSRRGRKIIDEITNDLDIVTLTINVAVQAQA